MKGIILAAGMGTRLKNYTRDRPKGLLEFDGVSLLERQISAMRKNGIEKIIVVKGYMQDLIKFSDITYFVNNRYKETNMVESLFCAETELDDDCIVTYSDIIYDYNLLNQITSSKCDIGVAVDKDFENYWRARLGSNYENDMESLVVEDGRITSLGKLNPDKNEVSARYIGIIKFSKRGIEKMKDYYTKFKLNKTVSKWENRVFRNWHMTDLLQAMIDEGCLIEPITVSKGWLEFDTERDYNLYREWLENGVLEDFIQL